MESSIDLLITAGGDVAVVEFEDNIVVVGVEVDEVLYFLFRKGKHSYFL